MATLAGGVSFVSVGPSEGAPNAMLHFYKFSEDVPAPVPAKPVYEKREGGRGWPEECPPLRAANAFGWDVLAATDMVFVQEDGRWRQEEPVVLETDWVYGAEGEIDDDPEGEDAGVPLSQQNAWFWEENQVLPHVISREVYPEIQNQVKVSTFLFLWTDPNELLFMTDIPNRHRPWRAMQALVDTDWYPASYPWHTVLELDRSESRIEIAKGEPICRLFTVRRDTYFAREATVEQFQAYFQRTQEWLQRFGKGQQEGMTDITGAYRKHQQPARFSVTF
jgi:hypothetical protein